MQPGFLAQRTVLDDRAATTVRLPFVPEVEALHPGGCFPLVEDPRVGDRATVLGMMVLRPASARWTPSLQPGRVGGELAGVRDWCFDVDGLGGSWPVSGGDALDAWRLALQYGTVDAVMAGASTFAREGLVAGARRGHLWQPYTPLAWAPLAAHRATLEAAIAAQRSAWQAMGLLSARRWPAQVAIARSGRVEPGGNDILDARAFHERHPDGSPIEAWLLTSEEGADTLRARARSKGQRVDERLLVASPPGRPSDLDVAAVPALLRRRLDARLVEHDGGAVTLEAFVDAGAVAQLQLTLMRRRSVRDVLERSGRIDDATRARVLDGWPAGARLFPRDGVLPERWKPVYAIEDAAEGGEAVVVTLDSRPRPDA